MLFCTYQYFLFFCVVMILFYLGPRRWRTLLLLIASYLFYMSWNWKFIPLLAGLTVIDYDFFSGLDWLDLLSGI
jgi:alginate O-acetyltransferase complex protein AlgI